MTSAALYRAEYYKLANFTQKQASFQLLNECYDLIRSLPFPVQVADIGCGTGNVTELMTNFPNVTHIHGFDLDQDMVETAKSLYESARMSFSVADVDVPGSIPKEYNGKFQLATSFSAIHWFADVDKAVANIRQLLTPNGLFVSQGAGKVLERKKICANVARSDRWKSIANENNIQRHLYAHAKWINSADPKGAMQKVLEANNFEVKRCEIVETVAYCSYDNLKAKLSSFARTIVDDTNEARYQEYLEEATQAVAAPLKQERDHYIMPTTRLFIVAVAKE